MKKQKKDSIAAILPVYNGEAFIAATIKSLLNQTRKFDEIIVVDDGSTDKTIEIVKKFKIKLIQTKHKERSAARNIGWRKSKCSIIAIIESDAVFNEVWAAEVLKTFKKGFDAVIDRRKYYQPKSFIAKMNDHFFELRFRKQYKPFSAWAIKRTILKKLQGFDETLTGPEDVDLGKRILDNGYKIGLAYAAVQRHKGEPTTLRGAIRRSFWLGSHIVPYWKKHKITPKKKVAVFTSLPFTLLQIEIFLFLILLLYAWIFIKDRKRGMEGKYLGFHPLYTIITELTFYWGFWYGSLGKSIKSVR